MLTDVDGVYSGNPQLDPNATLVRSAASFEELSRVTVQGQSAYGRGGMSSKIEAARVASISGVNTVIASGLRSGVVRAILFGKDTPGTFVAGRRMVHGRKRWLGLASGFDGVLLINSGAKTALLEKQASLLPAGVVGVEGDFSANQVVSIQDQQGNELGRGLVNFSAAQIQKIKGLQSSEIKKVLGLVEEECRSEIIHRDKLVVFDELAL